MAWKFTVVLNDRAAELLIFFFDKKENLMLEVKNTSVNKKKKMGKRHFQMWMNLN